MDEKDKTRWPQYGSARLSANQFYTILRAVYRSRPQAKSLLPVLLLLLYVLGLYVRLPGAVESGESDLGRWWFIRLGDLLFTGGSLGRAGILSSAFVIFLTPWYYTSEKWFRNLLLSLGALLGAAFATGWLLLAQGLLPSGSLLQQVAILFASSAAAKLIDEYLHFRELPGLGVIHLVVLLLYSVPHLPGGVAARQWLIDYAIFLAPVLLLLVSDRWLFRRGEMVEIENIRSETYQRRSKLFVDGLDKAVWEVIFLLMVVTYLLTAIPLSIAIGKPYLHDQGYLAILAPQATSMVLVGLLLPWLLFVFGESSGAEIAIRLRRKYWLVVGVKAGEATERHLEGIIERMRRRRFLLVLAWIAVTDLSFFLLDRRGTAQLFYPFGGLVFTYLVFSLWSHLTTWGSRVAMRLRTLRHEVTRSGNVVVDLFVKEQRLPLSLVDQASHLGASEVSLREHLEDFNFLFRGLIRGEQKKAQPMPGSAAGPLTPLMARLAGMLIAGLLTAALCGLVLVLAGIDDYAARVTTILGGFIAGLTFPSALRELLRKQERSGPSS